MFTRTEFKRLADRIEFPLTATSFVVALIGLYLYRTNTGLLLSGLFAAFVATHLITKRFERREQTLNDLFEATGSDVGLHSARIYYLVSSVFNCLTLGGLMACAVLIVFRIL